MHKKVKLNQLYLTVANQWGDSILGKITNKRYQQIADALSNWVKTYHKSGDDIFLEVSDDYEFTNIYWEGPYRSDEEDDDGNSEVDENLILYYLSLDKRLEDRIEYIKKYKKENPNTEDIVFDEAHFPEEFSDTDSLCVWYHVDTDSVEFVPDLGHNDNQRFVKNMDIFLKEFFD